MGYARRTPEETALHKLARENIWDFLGAALEQTGKRFPPFIIEAWRRFLNCGLGGAGFYRRACSDCGHEEILCFTCKGRLLCPSCTQRASMEGTAHLCNAVLPHVPMRQYVLSLPFELWHILGFQTGLMNRVQVVFNDSVQRWYQARANSLGIADGKTGGVQVLHRFNSSLGIMPHIHAIVLDGVYTPDGCFHALPIPTHAELLELCTTLRNRIIALLKRAKVVSGDPDDPLAACLRVAGQAGVRIGTAADDDRPQKSRYQLAVDVDGFNLDATTALSGTDRKRVERLCRYLLRGPLSLERLSIDSNGNAVYRRSLPDRHGRTELVMTPHQLLARLTAQIPAPHLCLRREFGVLAPRSPLRPKVVPVKDAPAVPPHIPWAQLIKAAFGTDPECCPKCGGRMIVVALVRDREQARRYLEGTGRYAELPGDRKPP